MRHRRVRGVVDHADGCLDAERSGTLAYQYDAGSNAFTYLLPAATWSGPGVGAPSAGLRVAANQQPRGYQPGVYDIASPHQQTFNVFSLPTSEQRTTLIGTAGASPSLVAVTVPQVVVTLSVDGQEMLDDLDEFLLLRPEPIPVYAETVRSALARIPIPPGLEIYPAIPNERPVLGGFPIAGPAGPTVNDMVDKAMRVLDAGGCTWCISQTTLEKLRIITDASLLAASTYALYRLTRLMGRIRPLSTWRASSPGLRRRVRRARIPSHFRRSRSRGRSV